MLVDKYIELIDRWGIRWITAAYLDDLFSHGHSRDPYEPYDYSPTHPELMGTEADEFRLLADDWTNLKGALRLIEAGLEEYQSTTPCDPLAAKSDLVKVAAFYPLPVGSDPRSSGDSMNVADQTAREALVRSLSWPPTRAYYAHRLALRVRELMATAERFDTEAPGSPCSELEVRDFFEAVYGVENVMGVGREIPRDHYPSERESDVWRAEKWLRQLLGELPSFDRLRGPLPPDALAYAQRFAEKPYQRSFGLILKLIPDPFDGPLGTTLALFEWASFHLDARPDEWNFDAPIPSEFWREWHGYRRTSDREDPDAAKAPQRTLLTRFGILRAVGARVPDSTATPGHILALERQAEPLPTPLLPPASETTIAPRNANKSSAAKSKKIPDIAYEAFSLSITHGLGQTVIAKRLSEKYGKTYSQGVISRWIKAVKEVSRDHDSQPRVRVIPTDPARLELGRRSQNNARRNPAD